MIEKAEFYFPRDIEWREWLHANHAKYSHGINLIFYKLELEVPTMRWEEAVKVALCYGWIDSTVKSLGNGKRQQYFCPRNPKSYWSSINKSYIVELEREGLLHKAGLEIITIAKETGTWNAFDEVENLIVPKDLQRAFSMNKTALQNFINFTPGYRKSYLSWLFHAKRDETRHKRITEIIKLCEANIKSRI